MPRGGTRKGTPGTAYSNRSDLNKPVPVQAAPNQPYGQAGAQIASQQVVPVAPPPAPPAGGPPQQAAPPPQPGNPGDFGRPTDMPNQPITHGLPTGPGAGPEALQYNGVSSNDQIDIKNLQSYLPVLELMASQPGASIATMNFVRRIRGSMPSA